MEPLYAPIVASAHALVATMGWQVEVDGLEHLPAEGPAIVAANHISYLDPLPLLHSAHRRGRYLRFMAKRSLFDLPMAGPPLRQMRHVPVERGADRGRSLEGAADLLRRGEVVALFPESTISVSFVPMSLKPGAARLALDTGAPLLPFAAFGAQRIATKQRPRRLQRGVAITGVYGPALQIQAGDDVLGITERLGARLREMVDGLATSYPQVPRTGPDVWWMPAHLGGLAPTVDDAEALRERERTARQGAED